VSAHSWPQFGDEDPSPSAQWEARSAGGPYTNAAWELCRDLVEQLIATARAKALQRSPEGHSPHVDWVSIWSAGDAATSREDAISRITSAAIAEATSIATGSNSQESDNSGLSEPTEPTMHQLLFGGPPVEVGRNLKIDDGPSVHELLFGPLDAEPVEAMPPAILDRALHEPLQDFQSPIPQTVHEPQTESPIHLTVDPAVIPHDAHRFHIGSRAFTFWTWTRNVGIIVVLFVVWQLYGTAISQHHAQQTLHTAFLADVRTHHAPPHSASGSALIPATQQLQSPAEGSIVGRIQVPAIGVDQIVVSGTADGDLSEGPGLYTGTALPGQAGNVAIAGHRTTHGAPFNELGSLKPGDPVLLTTTWGEKLTYVVSQPPQAVSPSDVAVLNYFGDNRITLTTCNPEFSASQRLVVVALLKTPEKVAPAAKKARVRYHLVNSATASWNWSLLPAAVLLVALLVLLAMSNRRFTAWFGRAGRWLILAPIWAVGLYVLFQILTSFLPAAV
jgi:LPXTG-site transpeptidase (sortase) family protein